MVDGWTGRTACALQEAMRMSNLEFASRLGIGLRTVGDWHEKPDMRQRLDMQRVLDTALEQAPASVRERFASLVGQPEPAQPPAPIPANAIAGPVIHNLPAPGNRVFVDRADTIAKLGQMTGQPGAAPPVVHGLGGSGKSALALHFAHSSRQRFPLLWWIPADSPVSITTGFAQLAARLEPDIAGKTSADAAEWALNWLQENSGWLLVFDDASPQHLETVLGTLSGGTALITTRMATGWHRIGETIPLAELPPDAALEMLTQIGNPGLGPEDEADLELLAAELGHLPLALEQAAAYIHATALSPRTYIDRLRRYPARMFAATAIAESPAEESDRRRTIARIWQLSLQEISAAQPLAGEILLTLAWFASDPVPRDLIYQMHDDPVTVDESLAMLHSYSLIGLSPRVVTVHRLIQAVARLSDPVDPHRTPEAIRSARDRAAGILLSSLPEQPLLNVSDWPRWRELIPHILAYISYIDPSQDTLVIADILATACGYLQGDGHWATAISTGRRAVNAYERIQGPDSPGTLIARSFLASAYRAAGDYGQAAPLHYQVASESARVLGDDHPETLAARANLAYLYALQGRMAEARELHERNLADYERILGPDHPHTINARANLASSYRELGDLSRAIELHEQSLEGYARVFGPGHAETITARTNVAYAYQLAGDLARAIQLYRQAVSERERLYGASHRLTELARQLLATAEQQAQESEP
jgi:tetratricopeptide (TPR) repeat protein